MITKQESVEIPPDFELPPGFELVEDEDGAPLPHRVQQIIAWREQNEDEPLTGLDAAIEYVLLALEAASSREIVGLEVALAGLCDLATDES